MSSLIALTPVLQSLSNKLEEIIRNHLQDVKQFQVDEPMYDHKQKELRFQFGWMRQSDSEAGDIPRSASLKIWVQKNELWYSEYIANIRIAFTSNWEYGYLWNHPGLKQQADEIEQALKPMIHTEINTAVRCVIRNVLVEYLAVNKIEILPIPDLTNIVLDYMFTEENV